MDIESRLLPQVTDDILSSILLDLRANKNYQIEIQQRVEKENPYIAEYIDKFSSSNQNPDDTSLVAYLIYDLLDNSGKIPKVEFDTVKSFNEEILNNKNIYAVTLVRHIQRENPCVINFICRVALKSSCPVEITYAGTMVYRMLEKQLVVDQMKDSILQ